MPENCSINPDRECPNATKMALLEKRVEHLEDGQEREEKFRKAYYEEREAKIERDAKLNAKIDRMDEKLDMVVAYQEAQQQKPGRFLDKMKENAWWMVICTVLGAMLMRLGFSV